LSTLLWSQAHAKPRLQRRDPVRRAKRPAHGLGREEVAPQALRTVVARKERGGLWKPREGRATST
jgi:hypothetical protein